MNEKELMSEHEHTYQNRLGSLGYGPKDIPSAAHHNAAVEEADQRIESIRKDKAESALQALRELRESL